MVHISDSPILSYARASIPRVLELKPSQLNKNETGLNFNPVLIFLASNDFGLSCSELVAKTETIHDVLVYTVVRTFHV